MWDGRQNRGMQSGVGEGLLDDKHLNCDLKNEQELKEVSFKCMEVILKAW